MAISLYLLQYLGITLRTARKAGKAPDRYLSLGVREHCRGSFSLTTMYGLGKYLLVWGARPSPPLSRGQVGTFFYMSMGNPASGNDSKRGLLVMSICTYLHQVVENHYMAPCCSPGSTAACQVPGN